MKLVPLILSGGSGSRLWPLSRELFPKQFISLFSNQSLFQDTLRRCQSIQTVSVEDPVVICNEEHRFLVAEQFREAGITPGGILLEPIGRNTAPAVAAVSHFIKKKYRRSNDDICLLVLPADHVISEVSEFVKAVEQAINLALDEHLVTFGIVPDQPHTGFGYIKKGLENRNNNGFEVLQFVEKPNLKLAEQYVASGEYLWNSGMFLFKATTYLEALQQFEPLMVDYCLDAVNQGKDDMNFHRLHPDAFKSCPSNSIDYAVMEHAVESQIKTSVIPLDAGWNDVGSWGALWEVLKHDQHGNAVKGSVVTEDTTDSLLFCDQGILATVGVKDLIVVRTADAVLVADQQKSEEVKLIVDQLKKDNYPQAMIHRKAARPWGTYDCIDDSERFKVKRIVVKPKAKLSLQMHHHRAEHWIVVKGTARVQKGDEVLLVTENESVYIPIGMKHSLENPGAIPLELIEVQSGSYLEEDDIVRFEDLYQRA